MEPMPAPQPKVSLFKDEFKRHSLPKRKSEGGVPLIVVTTTTKKTVGGRPMSAVTKKSNNKTDRPKRNAKQLGSDNQLPNPG